ncbi:MULTISPECIES: hypothetical protein [Terrabacteria group]
MDYQRHNVAPPGHADLPFAGDASLAEVLGVIDQLSALGRDLRATVPTASLRGSQYLRAADLARWIADAADELHQDLNQDSSIPLQTD